VESGSCRDGDALDADERQRTVGSAFDFKAQLARFAASFGDLVERPALAYGTPGSVGTEAL